jgi:hypothetical protein
MLEPWAMRFVMASKPIFNIGMRRELLTNSMEMSPYWEATSCPATQDFPNILWNPKFHYRINEITPLVSILRQISPYHVIPFLKIDFNMVLPPTSRPPSFWLSHQNPICIPLLSHAAYMPCPSHPPWLDLSNYIWRRVQVMKLLFYNFLYPLIISSLFLWHEVLYVVIGSL